MDVPTALPTSAVLSAAAAWSPPSPRSVGDRGAGKAAERASIKDPSGEPESGKKHCIDDPR